MVDLTPAFVAAARGPGRDAAALPPGPVPPERRGPRRCGRDNPPVPDGGRGASPAGATLRRPAGGGITRRGGRHEDTRLDRSPSPWPLLAGPALAPTVPSPSEFLGLSVGADRTVADYRQILAYFKALDAASPRVELEILGKTTLGEDLFLAGHLLGGEPREQEATPGDRAEDRRPAGTLRGGGGRPRARGEGLSLHHLQHPLDRDRRLPDGDGVGARARDGPGRGDEAPPRRGGAPAAALDQPRRPGDGDRVVPQEPRDAVRGWPDAVALPPLRRPRRQPRLVHAHPEGDAGRLPRRLPRVAPAGVARRAPDGRDRAPHVRPALRGAGRPRHPPARLARREPHRREHGLPARAGAEDRRHLRLRVRRLLAGRDEEHRLVEEHLRPPHRGRLGAVRDARPHRAERAAGWRQGARGVRPADELPEPLARGRVAAARHHGLRADRLRRDPRDLRGKARRLPAQRARAGPRRDRHLVRGMPSGSPRTRGTRRAPPAWPPSSPSTASSSWRPRTATSTSRSPSRTAAS